MWWCASRKLPSWTIVAYFGGNVESGRDVGNDCHRDEKPYLRGASFGETGPQKIIRPGNHSRPATKAVLEDRTNHDASVGEER